MLSYLTFVSKVQKRQNNFREPNIKLSEWIAQRQVTFIFKKFKVVYIRWNYVNAFYKIT